MNIVVSALVWLIKVLLHWRRIRLMASWSCYGRRYTHEECNKICKFVNVTSKSCRDDLMKALNHSFVSGNAKFAWLTSDCAYIRNCDHCDPQCSSCEWQATCAVSINNTKPLIEMCSTMLPLSLCGVTGYCVDAYELRNLIKDANAL